MWNEKPAHQKEDVDEEHPESAPRPPRVDTPRLAGAADDGCVPDYRHILAKSHAVPASFAQNDVKNTGPMARRGRDHLAFDNARTLPFYSLSC